MGDVSGPGAGRLLPDDAASVQQLYDSWKKIERALNIALQSTQSVGFPLENKHIKGEGGQSLTIDDLSQAQLEVLRGLIETPARHEAEASKKLLAWRDLIAPDGQDTGWLPPTDQLVLSILSDMERLA